MQAVKADSLQNYSERFVGSIPALRANLEIIELFYFIYRIKKLKMNKKLKSSKILRFAKKMKCVELLGSKCEICGDNNIFHLVFHHNDSELKEFHINNLLNSSLSDIKKELNKCKLLCANCHGELHFNNEINGEYTEQRRYNKKMFVDYKGCECSKCGYNKNNISLSFHHKNPNEKVFEFGGFRTKLTTIKDLDNYLVEELDKCDLLCNNCHMEYQFDIDFYNENYNKIIEKLKNYKEKQAKLPVDEVLNMYNNGKKQIEIARFFKASKGTISGIIKKIKLEVPIVRG